MSSIKIIPIKRYAVTRKSCNADAPVETVADDLTLSQAQDIAHAMQAREHQAGMASSLIDESEDWHQPASQNRDRSMASQAIEMKVRVVDMEPVKSLIYALALEWSYLPPIVQERLKEVIDTTPPTSTQ